MSGSAVQDEKLRRLPARFRLNGAAGYAAPAFVLAPSCRALELADELLTNEWRSREGIEARQLTQLRMLLQFAEEECPFYSDRIRACGLNPMAMESLEELRAMPLLTRAQIQDRLVKLTPRHMPDGTRRSGEIKSSGAMGTPVRVRGTNVTAVMWAACTLRDMAWAGIDPGWTLVSIRQFEDGTPANTAPDGIHSPGWGGPIGAAVLTGTSHLIDIGRDLDKQLKLLKDVDPDMLVSYPSHLETLAQAVFAESIELKNLKVVQTIGEVLPDHMRESIERLFGARVTDIYSCIEVGYIAGQCPEGHGYHVHEENVIVEVVDERGDPCEDGEPGRVVVTSLVNYASPIIRYELGDCASLTCEPCPCGRGLKRIDRIMGRQRGQILLPDGTLKYSSPLSGILRRTGLLRQFKVIQHERDRLEVLVVPREKFGEEEQKQITQTFREFLGFPAEVSFTVVPHIDREPGGKYIEFLRMAK